MMMQIVHSLLTYVHARCGIISIEKERVQDENSQTAS